MADDRQKNDYLDEHLPYMLKMLRYTHEQMCQRQHYLSWNAHFELFAVHARNLMNFLSNNDKKNLQARDFVTGGFKARTKDVGRLLQKLEQQVFHLAENRPKDTIGKFNTDHADRVRKWIEQNFAAFLAASELRAAFNEKKADPTADQAMYVTLGSAAPGGAIACTAGPLPSQNATTSEPTKFGNDGSAQRPRSLIAAFTMAAGRVAD